MRENVKRKVFSVAEGHPSMNYPQHKTMIALCVVTQFASD